MRNVTFCKICSFEIKKVILYEHFISREHKEIDDSLMRGMTYCEHCGKEKWNDEWRKHINSEEHLQFKHKNYCEVCKKKYLVWDRYPGNFKEKSKAAEQQHETGVNCDGNTNHKLNLEGIKFYSK